MNTAYSEELSPPKELFSREWFDIWNDYHPFPTYDRIDQTKRKLEDLETKLRQKIWKRGGGYKQDLLVDTITLLNSHIGVWQATKLHTPSNISPITPPITMVYPHTSRIISTWDEVVLGKVQRTGVCVAMLSPECVEWLNTISDWVSE